jgi:hypothetical protein
MTERPRNERPRARRPSFAPVFWGSIALFAVLFALLAYQLSSGNDPSLGALASGNASRPVLVRKVVKRRIVTTIVPTPGASGVSSGPVTTSSAPVVSSSGSAPVTTSAS